LISFFVSGTPRPGGSKTPLGRGANGKLRIREAGRHTMAWRELVGWAGRQAMGPRQPLAGPLRVSFTFNMPRPQAHLLRGQLRSTAPAHHTHAPDTTKLIRSTEDALTGVCWVDDAQIVQQQASKGYAEADLGPGVYITIEPLARE
jgi:Holliday junction resolvase RusA-like endonuclease